MKIINGVRYTDADAKILGLLDEAEPATPPQAGELHAALAVASYNQPAPQAADDDKPDTAKSDTEPDTAQGDAGKGAAEQTGDDGAADTTENEATPPDGGEAGEDTADGDAGEPVRPRAARRRTKS